jgi:5'-nucleotidase
MEQPAVLLTNDDGIDAPGLLTLKRELDVFARVQVYAPEKNWSAASRTMTFHKPLRITEVVLPDESIGHTTSGSPTDCVALALLGSLRASKPQLVISGINAGLNVGQDISYSGTVAAAMEGVRNGIPTIAVSQHVNLDRADGTDYAMAARFTAQLARFLLQRPVLPRGTLLNVNVPAVAADAEPEVVLTRQGGEAHNNYLVQGQDPRGRAYFWIAGDRLDDSPGRSDTDTWAVAHGKISVTPIHLDMTDTALLQALKELPDFPSHAPP